MHCEYFRPAKPGKYPACVVLHILGGDFPLARVFAYHLAQHGVAALFVKMPYYGERRQPGVNIRMVSTNPAQTVEGLTQGVKDIRYAAAWLAAQDEVDAQQLGIFGISLGGIMATLAAEAEPRFARCCPVLAGGDLGRVLADSQERHLVEAKRRWTADGHTLPELLDLMKTIDPCNYGAALQARKVLMLNASHDEVIPRKCTDSLWEAIGRPPIFWYDAGHFTAMLYISDALDKVERIHGQRRGARECRRQNAEGRIRVPVLLSAFCRYYHCPSVTCLVSTSSPRRISSFTRSPPYFSATRSVNSLKL